MLNSISMPNQRKFLFRDTSNLSDQIKETLYEQSKKASGGISKKAPISKGFGYHQKTTL